MNYVLNLFNERQFRRVRVVENILKNRRTVSNLFWAQQYGLLQWQGAYRTLTREHYEAILQSFEQSGWLTIQNEQARLTTQGVIAQEELRATCYRPSFLDWYWLTNTKVLEERLLLGVQVVSALMYHQRRYIPIISAPDQLSLIKQWLRKNRQSNQQLGHIFYTELLTICETLASEDQRAANLLVALLPGAHTSGDSLGMMAAQMKMDIDQVEIIKHDVLLAVAAYAAHSDGVLHSLLADLLSAGPLSATVERSLTLLQSGKSVEEISQQRTLKATTIREHILEAAIIKPQLLDWQSLIPHDQQARLTEQYGHGQPAEWHYEGPMHDPVSFFYFRLWQIIQGGLSND